MVVDVFFGLALLQRTLPIVSIAFGWVSLPEQTWHDFVLALERGDVEAANRLCDQDSLQVKGAGIPGEYVLLVRSQQIPQWMRTNIWLDEIRGRDYEMTTRSIADWLAGRAHVGRAGAVLYGHLIVERCRIGFVPEKRR